MAKAPATEQLFLEGPAGRLEAVLDRPGEDSPRAVVLVLHPHPQYGGTLTNKVTHTLARTFVGLGFAALRFNFRGTGASAGAWDDGVGELDDALAAAAWLRGRYAHGPFWLAGFSFGAAIAIRAAVETSPAGLVSVAPAVQRFASGLARQPDCPWLVIQGDADELVDVDDTVAWVDSLEPGPDLQVLPGVDHFFHGKLVVLREAVTTFVTEHLNS
jgi:alpha/beta superfamily hydrolase